MKKRVKEKILILLAATQLEERIVTLVQNS